MAREKRMMCRMSLVGRSRFGLLIYVLGTEKQGRDVDRGSGVDKG
jgi:hypothetical protein